MRIEPALPQAAVRPTQQPPATATDELQTGSGPGRDVSHALFQGKGNKTGILKRMSSEEIAAVQDELGVKAAATAATLLAERAAATVDTDVVDPGQGEGDAPVAPDAPEQPDGSEPTGEVVVDTSGVLAGSTLVGPFVAPTDTVDEPTPLEEYIEEVTPPG